MKHSLKYAGLALAVATCLPLTLSAHRQWILPSATVLSGTGKWVTVDAAVSNDIFYFEHFPMKLDNLVVTAPDGTTVKPENPSTGRYRSTFDVELKQNGTYRIGVVTNSVMASWEENGETKRWRGTPEKFETEVPKDAKNLQVSRMQSRVETFVTSNKPSPLKTIGQGLELSPITHPNDLVTGEEAKFAVLLNGKPTPNLEVTLIPAGIRYRDKLEEIKVKTDADGKFAVKFTLPGMYWLNAMYQEGGSPRRQEPSGAGEGWQAAGQAAGERPRRGPGGPGGPGGRMPSGNRSNYVATIEVMTQ